MCDTPAYAHNLRDGEGGINIQMCVVDLIVRRDVCQPSQHFVRETGYHGWYFDQSDGTGHPSQLRVPRTGYHGWAWLQRADHPSQLSVGETGYHERASQPPVAGHSSQLSVPGTCYHEWAL